MTRLGEVANFETVDAEVREVDGTRVRVATPAALYRMKKGTVRSQDHVDDAAQVNTSVSNMRVQKFRSIEEMNKAPDPRSGSSDAAANSERFLRHCARWWAIAPKQYPRGVFKFRTLEEAQKAREKHLPLK
jgi:major membrane immunogen (membrane-anchored lipoprotein)